MADDGIDEHPLDAAIEKVPGVVRLRRKLHRARELVARQISDQRIWVTQQDLESAYRSVREDLYFDVGYTFGVVAGRSEPRMSRAARRLAKEFRTLALMAQLRPADVVAALQETTRAILDLNGTTRR
jgi:hypothetical protein